MPTGTALADMKNLPKGSIVGKEGFEDDQGDLNAPKINSSSCIRCHKKADGGDFSFAND